MRVKPVCFYLPQFHRIPENDRWWGEGFTEWTMVRRAVPLFPGHRQPIEPARPGPGYYDLLDRKVRKQHGELARSHGIHAFCYYHYWFGGKRLLEGPLERILEDGEPDLPFMLCWANEPWTRRWDGQDQHILQPQEYGNESDWAAHFETLVRFFRDPRYVHVAGCPVLVIYRAGHIPSLGRMLRFWREQARRAGFVDLHIVSVLGNFQDNASVPPDVDAVCEFFPAWSAALGLRVNRLSGVRITTAEQAWRVAMNGPRLHNVQYRGAFQSWDNTPRCGAGGLVYLPLEVDRFRILIEEQMRRTLEDPALPEPFVFINAWNEWGEGCHLEPDEVHKTTRLESVREAVEASARSRSPVVATETRTTSQLLAFIGESDDYVATVEMSEVADQVTCDRFHRLVPYLTRQAHIVVLGTLDAELLDLVASRCAADKPLVLDVDAILGRGTLEPSMERVRRDLLQHARKFANAVFGDVTAAEGLTHIPLSAQGLTRFIENSRNDEVDVSDIVTQRRSSHFDDTKCANHFVYRLGSGADGSECRKALISPSTPELLQALLTIADRRPDYLLPLRHAGRAFNDLRQPDDALSLLRMILHQDKLDSAALCETGRALFLLGETAQAREILSATLVRAPWHIRGWQYLLRLLELTHDSEGSEWAARACAAHPFNYAIGVLAARACCAADAATVLLARVVDNLAKTLKSDEVVAAGEMIGRACANVGQLQLATDDGLVLLKHACSLFQNSAHLADIYGNVLRATGRFTEAHTEHARAAEVRRVALTWRAEQE